MATSSTASLEDLPDPGQETLVIYTKCREELDHSYVEEFKQIPKPEEHYPWFTKYIATYVCENFIMWPEAGKMRRPNDKTKCRAKIVDDVKALDIVKIHKKLQHEVAKWMTHIKSSEIETEKFNEAMFDRYYKRRFEDLMGWINPTLEFIQDYQTDFLYLSDQDEELIHGHIEKIKDQYNLGRLGLKQKGSPPKDPESKVENAVVRELETELNRLKRRILVADKYVQSLSSNPKESVCAQRKNERPLDKQIMDILREIVAAMDVWKKEFRDTESKKYVESAEFFLRHVITQFNVLREKEKQLGFQRNESFRKPEKMEKDHFFDTETSCVELSKINITLGNIYSRDAWITRELKKKALAEKAAAAKVQVQVQAKKNPNKKEKQ
ncbi:Protein CBG00212 [Caenorhabditis briggsae]|uniref:Protein CBG00212 n=3 Tax=Caenorhabditis briggsae TaxID=6238 RepID=A8WMH3_CAEBR|nr:Protein CBG00212 [Caenorhabditis briggsae]ULT83640.1 hypothetical protein L3Y34_012703 [Caenorhabditis briggsae]CAP21678.2 Protein CBG00212 [Caenorhabditis briggsae]